MKRLSLWLWLLGHVACADSSIDSGMPLATGSRQLPRLAPLGSPIGQACWDGVAASGPLIAAWSEKLLLVSSDGGDRFRAARTGELGTVALGGGRLYVTRGKS